jgi:linoleoyl-CoA desaturase
MANEKNGIPRFNKSQTDTDLFNELRKRVMEVVHDLPGKRHRMATFKAFLLPAIYVSLYFAALFTKSYLIFCSFYFLLGLMLVIIFLNLIHEACHDNLFKSKKMNRVYLLLFDLIGANSFIWKKRHNRLHHHFTNVSGWDSDIEKSRFLKVHPGDEKKFFVRYQHLLIFLYPLFITNWFLIRDFKDFFSSKMIVRKLGDIPLPEYVKLFFFKLFFAGYLFVLPALVTPFGWASVLAAFFIMLVSAGFFALIVLLPPHVNTSNQFPQVDKKMNLPQSWFMHQLNTTNDVRGYNWFTRHVMANFNLHLAHHLFPNVSYVYAKEVTNEIIRFNKEKGLNYRSYPILATFKNHYRLIRSNGRILNILDEDM